MSKILIIILVFGNLHLASSQEIKKSFVDLTEYDSSFFKINTKRYDPVITILKKKFWKEGWEKPEKILEDDDVVIISAPESRYLILDSFDSPDLISISTINKTIKLKDLANENSPIWNTLSYPYYFYVITEKYQNRLAKVYKMKIRANE